MKKSLIYGSAFADDPDAPDLAMARNYRHGSWNYIGHDSTEIVHVCDDACAQTVIEEVGGYVECDNVPGRYISAEEISGRNDGLSYRATIDVYDFDPGDDPYILCAACGTELLRDDDRYEDMFGHTIGNH